MTLSCWGSNSGFSRGGDRVSSYTINLVFRKSPQPSIDRSPAPTGTRTHACLAVSQLLSNQVAGSQIPAIGSCLKSFSTTGAATGNRTRVSRLHVQRADHYTMAEEWGLQDTHPLWRSKSGEEHCNISCNLTRIATLVASSQSRLQSHGSHG